MSTLWNEVLPVPCAHIALYYNRLWEEHKCLAWQFLRKGYSQASEGKVEACNNLFDWASVKEDDENEQ